jgi:hypothetical protein
MDISPYFARSVHHEEVVYTGWVVGAGASAPTIPTSNDNLVESTARTSEGLYVITFREGVPKILHVIPTIEAASGLFKQVYVVSKSISARTVTVQVMLANGGGVDDIETTDTLYMTVRSRIADD